MRANKTRRWWRLHLASVLILVASTAFVTATASFEAQAAKDNDRQLLVQDAGLTANSFNATFGQIQGLINSAASVATATNGDPAAFTRFVTSQAAWIQTWSLLRVGPFGPVPVSDVGPSPAGIRTPTSAVRRSLDAIPVGSFRVLGFFGSGSSRGLGLGQRVGDYLVYAQITLPQAEADSQTASPGMPSKLFFALYTTSSEGRSDVVFANTPHLPLTDRRAAVLLSPNDTNEPKVVLGTQPGRVAVPPGQVLLVVAPTGHLGGPLGFTVPWVVFIVGLVASLAGACAIETTLRRRDDALASVRGLEAKNRALDEAMAEQARAERERAQLEAQLRAAHRLEAVGKLAGGIAHDFNNLLAVILNYAAFAVEDLGDHPANGDVEEVVRAARRAAELTRQLLVFSRQDVVEPSLIDLNKVVRSMERLLERTLGEDLRLRTELDPGLYPVLADEGELEQVLMNLAVNARDAISAQGGLLTITTNRFAIDEATAPRHPGMAPGDYVRLIVRDNGSGMTPDVLASAFEPFFTTKGPGEGTGLGLATVYGIVTRWGGQVVAASEPGRGTEVTVLLPAAIDTSHVDRTPVPVRTRQTAPAGQVVLLVEDEDGVRTAANRILSAAGYEIVEAASGAAALELDFDAPPDLLLTDVVMPGGVSGRELADALVSRWPALEVVFMSGYTADVISHRGVLDEGIVLVDKPFTAATLLEAVSGALDSRGSNTDGRVSNGEGRATTADHRPVELRR